MVGLWTLVVVIAADLKTEEKTKLNLRLVYRGTHNSLLMSFKINKNREVKPAKKVEHIDVERRMASLVIMLYRCRWLLFFNDSICIHIIIPTGTGSRLKKEDLVRPWWNVCFVIYIQSQSEIDRNSKRWWYLLLIVFDSILLVRRTYRHYKSITDKERCLEK